MKAPLPKSIKIKSQDIIESHLATGRPSSPTNAIEELEKLAKKLEDANDDAISMSILAEALRILATRIRTEESERERAAVRAAWLEGGRRWSECSWNADDAAKEADQYVAETYTDKEA